MRIRKIIWFDSIVEKLAVKHHVDTTEVEEVLNSNPKFFFVESGDRKGEDLYLAAGRTYANRPLLVYFIHKASGDALIISARQMKRKEIRRYERT